MSAALALPTDCCDCCPCDDVPTLSSVVGWFSADTAAAGRMISTASTNRILVLNGLVTVGDGLGGIYRWNNSSVAADNGTTVLKPSDNTTAGRWLKD